MSNDLEEKLSKIIEERVEEVGNCIISKNDEFIGVCKKSEVLFKEIKDLLPYDRKSLIFEFDNLMSRRSSIAETIMYKQGIKDGIKLLDG